MHTIVPTDFQWYGKMEFKFHFRFSVFCGIKNGFEFPVSFWISLPMIGKRIRVSFFFIFRFPMLLKNDVNFFFFFSFKYLNVLFGR